MKLPAQLQADLEEAEALHAELYAEATGEEELQEETLPDDALQLDLTGGEEGDGQEEEPEQPAAAPPVPAPDAGALLARLAQLERTVAQLMVRLQAQSELAQPAAVDLDKISLASEADIEEYGEDLVKLSERLVRNLGKEVAPKIMASIQNQLVPVVANSVSEAKQVVAVNRGNTVYQALDAAIPNWKGVNASPGWQAWLGETDTMSGHVRDELLKEAFANGDAKRVVAFFEAYLQINPQKSSPAKPAEKGKIPLADLAGPAAAAPTQPRRQEIKKQYTGADVQRAYDDLLVKRRQATRLKDSDMLKKLDADEVRLSKIFAEAMAEGRLQP